MKKVLIAIDYTPAAEKVAKAGYEIAKAQQADVKLVHAVGEPLYYAMDYSPIMGYTGTFAPGGEKVVEDLKKEAGEFLKSAASHLGNKNIGTTVLEGETSEAILDYSNEWKADLIVLGSHSPQGLDKLFGTDIAHYLIKNAKVPVLTVPTEEK